MRKVLEQRFAILLVGSSRYFISACGYSDERFESAHVIVLGNSDRAACLRREYKRGCWRIARNITL